jgi:hypothetical protein
VAPPLLIAEQVRGEVGTIVMDGTLRSITPSGPLSENTFAKAASGVLSG